MTCHALYESALRAEGDRRPGRGSLRRQPDPFDHHRRHRPPHPQHLLRDPGGPTGLRGTISLPAEVVISPLARVLFVDHYGIPGNLRAIEISATTWYSGCRRISNVTMSTRFYEMLHADRPPYRWSTFRGQDDGPG